MLHNVTTKSLYDQRRSLLAWAVSLVLLVAMYVAIWPSIRDQPAMTDFLNSMPVLATTASRILCRGGAVGAERP